MSNERVAIDLKKDAKYWVEKLKLQEHPGGFFKETYRAEESISQSALPPRFSGDRAFSTAIYYLLNRDDFSAFHRIRQDELWHFYYGSSLTIHVISEAGSYSTITMGNNIESGETLQAVVSRGAYFAAEVDDKESFSLTGCTVAPGFEFQDFEMAERENLVSKFPDHEEIIVRLTRVASPLVSDKNCH